MSRGLHAVLASALLAASCAGDRPDANHAQDPSQAANGTASAAAVNVAPTVTRTFPATGVKTVILRAADAARVTIQHSDRDTIEASGTMRGGAAGYRPSDPNWKETPLKEWGLDFVGQQFGDVLVLSTKNEMAFIHHAYDLHSLVLSVPTGVQVVPVKRELTGDGAPDLSPAPPPPPG